MRLSSYLGFIVVASSSCSLLESKSLLISKNEQRLIEQNPFDPSVRMTGVENELNTESSDSFYPQSDNRGAQNPYFLKHPCSQENYEVELEESLIKALADTTKKSIVVRYSFSFGMPFDAISYSAYNRTILRKEDDGITPIFVNPSSSGWGGGVQKSYFANHLNARAEYVEGKRCFFSVIQVKDEFAGLKLPFKSEQNAQGTWVANPFDHWIPGTPIVSPSSNPNQGMYQHELGGMYYGSAYHCNTPSDCERRMNSPRLFKSYDLIWDDYRLALEDWNRSDKKMKLSDWIKNQEPTRQAQLLPLFVADFRDMRLGHKPGVLVNPKYAASYVRTFEYEVVVKKMLNLLNIFQGREDLEKRWSKDEMIPLCNRGCNLDSCSGGWNTKPVCTTPHKWSAYEGVPQLIENILYGVQSGIVQSVVYTPIVLDLPSGDTPVQYQERKNIMTSSLEWGTYFNLANLVTKNSLDAEGKLLSSIQDAHHKTAWLGGKPEQAGYEITFNQHGNKEVYVNRAYDGFLVIPEIEKDAQGQELYCPDESPKYRVNRGHDLFGSYGVVGGKTVEFENGFAKLRDYINNSKTSFPKDCAPSVGPLTTADVKKRYFGVWDTLAYDLVKVWVDSNRNGSVDCGEIKSLRESKVAAINTCNLMMTKNEQGQVVPLKDLYGNETHLRAAFLVSDRSDLQLSEAETLQRIMTGIKSNEDDAEFRVAIDILFKTDKDHYLDDLLTSDLVELQ